MAFGCMFDGGSSMFASFLPRLLFSFLHVLRISVRGRFILPLEVAGDGGRYFWMMSAFRNGMPSSCSLLAALMSFAVEHCKNLVHILELVLLV